MKSGGASPDVADDMRVTAADSRIALARSQARGLLILVAATPPIECFDRADAFDLSPAGAQNESNVVSEPERLMP